MAIRFDKFTAKSQEAVQAAQSLAAERGNPQMEPLHLLAGLLAEREGIVDAVLDKIGANRSQLQRIVEADLWDRDHLDLVTPATMTIGVDGHGEIAWPGSNSNTAARWSSSPEPASTKWTRSAVPERLN